MVRLTKTSATGEQLEAQRLEARRLLRELAQLDEGQDKVYARLFGKSGKNLEIWQNYFCEFGGNIYFGDNVFINANAVFLDRFDIVIGDNVAIGPNVGFYTTNHSLIIEERRNHIEYGAPIHIGNDVWIGGHVAILPGVTIGCRCVVGAGSIVTRSIPEGMIFHGSVQKPADAILPNHTTRHA